MTGQPDDVPRGEKLFYYASRYPPFVIWCALLLIGVLATEKGKGRSPFLEHGGTKMALGACLLVMGLHAIRFAGRIVLENQARREKLDTRFPRIRKVILAISPDWRYPTVEHWVNRVRLVGICAFWFGIFLFVWGVCQL
jgi:hypothetical protein